MQGKQAAPKEPVPVRMRIVPLGPVALGRALNCGKCGYTLPTLTYLHLRSEYSQQAQRDAGGFSPNHLYIDWREMPGWWFDGETLRPTDEARAEYQRTREKVRTARRKETDIERKKVAGRAPLVPKRARDNVLFGTSRPAPRRIECLECGVENLIV
jgi:hypothetical protein